MKFYYKEMNPYFIYYSLNSSMTGHCKSAQNAYNGKPDNFRPIKLDARVQQSKYLGVIRWELEVIFRQQSRIDVYAYRSFEVGLGIIVTTVSNTQH